MRQAATVESIRTGQLLRGACLPVEVRFASPLDELGGH
jgi:hypothetical protein